jgi:DNA-binding XRE family transcriptional regulator
MKKVIDMTAVNLMYDITRNGEVYSHIRKRWLKPQLNSCEYVFYHLKPCGCVFAHTLVALKYIGPPPTPKHEINHKDSNRMNNYYLNLEWVTHSQNHILAYQNGKEHYWLGKHRPSPSIETKLLMANAKKKRIKFRGIVYESIQEAADILHINRRTISRIVNGYDSPKYGTAEVIQD